MTEAAVRDASPRRLVSGAKPGSGHFEEFLAHPALLLLRAWRECGDFAELDLAGMRNVLVVEPDALEAVFRAPDEQLSAAEAYQYMVPIFGEGIQFGAPLELEREQVKMQATALRPDRMKGYARIIAAEVEDWIRGWGDSGERDIHHEFKELVLRTSTHCLLGEEFRNKLSEEFGALLHDLELAVSPSSVLDPYGAEEIFARRDRSRARLAELVKTVIEERRRTGESHPDMLQVFMEVEYLDGSKLSDDEIVGMVVWIMFAGFHTSSNTATWTAVELARHPALAAPVAREVASIYDGAAGLGFASLREIPQLERFVLEVLRLHPPLVTLMRRVKSDFTYRDQRVPAGDMIAISPYVTHRNPAYYDEPERFDPLRPLPEHVFA